MSAQSMQQCQPASQNGNNCGMNIVQLTLLEALRRQQQHPAGQQAFFSAPAGLTRPLTRQQAAPDQAKASYQSSVKPLAAAVSSSNLNNESAKEENKRKMIPCRARGMPQDHNFKVSLSLEPTNPYLAMIVYRLNLTLVIFHLSSKTANFMITNDVKHGKGLVCSYPKCRDGGIKFLYCKYCAIPVSKRMFRTRHNNCGGKESAERSYEAKASTTEVAAAKEVEAKKYAKSSQGRSESCDSVKDSKPSEISLSSSDEGDSSRLGPTGKPHHALTQAPSGKPETKVPGYQQSQSKLIIPPPEAASAVSETKQAQQQEWARLLATRPSHEEDDKMSAWIMDVLSVSESCVPDKKDKPAEARSSDNKKGERAEESAPKNFQRTCEEREHMPLKKRKMAGYREEEQAQSRD
jgi:hypothetical protein